MNIYKDLLRISLIVLVVTFFLFSSSLAQQPSLFLNLYVNLELKSSSLEGFIEVRLLPKKAYQFDIKDLEVKEILLNGKPLSVTLKDKITVIGDEEQNNLFIKFEKPLNYHILPFNLIEKFFPSPNVPFKFQVILKIPKKIKVFTMIPSDFSERKEEGDYIVYTFIKNFPTLSPCLIISKEKLDEFKFNLENLELYLYRSPTVKKTEFEQIFKILEKNKKYIKTIEKLGNKGHPFSRLFIFLDENFERNLEFSNTILCSFNEFNSPRKIVITLLEKKFKDGLLPKNEKILQGLTSYLCEEIIFENPSKDFRKNLLVFSDEKAKTFFYILELVEKIGKTQFLKDLEEFWELNLFSQRDLSDFLDFLGKKYVQTIENFPLFKNFSKLKLQGEVLLLKREKEGYLIVLGIKKLENLYDNGGLEREIFLEIMIKTKNKEYFFKKPFKRYYQLFEFIVSEKPETILLDPNYLIWREINENERSFSIKDIFQEKGTLVFSSKEFYTYKKIIEIFKSQGYEILTVEDPSKFIPKESSNFIYFHSFPYRWLINPPDKGFYIKVIPNSIEMKTFIGFIFSSSSIETEKALKILSTLENYTEILIHSGKILYTKPLEETNGISVPLKDKFFGYSLKEPLEPREVSIKILKTPVVLIGEEEGNFEKFYQEFLEGLLLYNNKIILLLDLPSSLQDLIELYLQNKIQKEVLLSKIEKDKFSINIKTFNFLLDFAKLKNLKIYAIGVEEHLFKDILTKGILNLTQEEIQKLPEIDLTNPLLEKFLYEKYQEKKEKYPFENFYQAYVVRTETLVENLLRLYKRFSEHHLVVITSKDQILSTSGLAKLLETKNLFKFKTIILHKKVEDFSSFSDYLFSGGLPSAE